MHFSKHTKDDIAGLRAEVEYLRRCNTELVNELERERRNHAELHHHLLVHPHSGLPGRRSFTATLASIMQGKLPPDDRDAGYAASSFTMVIVKLDAKFDLIAKTLKESASEWILYQTAMRLKESLGGQDSIFHVADDEFVLLWRESPKQDVRKRLASLDGSLNRHHALAGVRLHIGANMGVAHYPTHGRNHQSLVQAANLALSRAIKTERPWVLYQEQLRQDVVEKMDLQNGIIRALESQSHGAPQSQFHLVYQPQVTLQRDTGNQLRISEINAEALLRWKHPVRGAVSPSHFIPLAEETGLIQPLGTWIIHQAIDQLRAWKGTAMEKAVISLNVSPKQFVNDQLVHSLDRLTRHEPQLARRIKLEVTESSLLENTDTCLRYMHYLRGLGIQFAVDDFGKDYSSLSYLRKLPVNTIKIDKSFIDNLPSSRHDQAIVRAISRLAHDLRLKVVVEGVETTTQLTTLLGEGCSTIQGFFFSRPLEAGAFGRFYKRALQRRLKLPQARESAG